MGHMKRVGSDSGAYPSLVTQFPGLVFSDVDETGTRAREFSLSLPTSLYRDSASSNSVLSCGHQMTSKALSIRLDYHSDVTDSLRSMEVSSFFFSFSETLELITSPESNWHSDAPYHLGLQRCTNESGTEPRPFHDTFRFFSSHNFHQFVCLFCVLRFDYPTVLIFVNVRHVFGNLKPPTGFLHSAVSQMV